MKDVAAPRGAQRYSVVAIVLHWLIAAAIVLQVSLAGRMEGPSTPTVFAVTQLHKSVGIAVLLLSLARLAWRLAHPPPRETYRLAGWERLLSRVTHWGFYGLMIAVPLTGWIMVSTSRVAVPTLLFGVVPWPHLPGLADLGGEARHLWREAGEVGHKALVKAIYLLLALHVAGALKHQLFAPGEPVLARMAPGAVVGRWLEPRLLLIALGAVAAFALGRLATPPTPYPPAAAPAVRPPAQAAPVPTRQAEATADQVAPVEAAAPAPVRWSIDPDSSLGFETAWSGDPVTGRFARWRGDILFAPDALGASKVRIEVDLASAAAGDPQIDGALISPDWLDAAAHPRAVFSAERFAARGQGRFVAYGRLSLRGVSRPLDLPFELKIDGDKARVRGVTTLDRTAFGVGQGEWTSTEQIPAQVTVSVDLTATRAGSPG